MCHVGGVDVLPMFPLGSPLLPGQPLPLQVFEPRYLAMLRDIAEGEGEFGVVLIERGFEVGGGDARFSVGCVASIERAKVMPDGRVRLLARGQERVAAHQPHIAAIGPGGPSGRGGLAPEGAEKLHLGVV